MSFFSVQLHHQVSCLLSLYQNPLCCTSHSNLFIGSLSFSILGSAEILIVDLRGPDDEFLMTI